MHGPHVTTFPGKLNALTALDSATPHHGLGLVYLKVAVMHTWDELCYPIDEKVNKGDDAPDVTYEQMEAFCCAWDKDDSVDPSWIKTCLEYVNQWHSNDIFWK